MSFIRCETSAVLLPDLFSFTHERENVVLQRGLVRHHPTVNVDGLCVSKSRGDQVNPNHVNTD